MNPNVVASYALIAKLRDLGATHAVISPGSRSMPLSYCANELLDTLTVIDERDAGFCALGIAESTNLPVLVITTSGSAPTHLFPSVTESSGSNVPLIVISADRPHEVRGRGAPQTIDQVELFSTHSRFFLDTPLPKDNSEPKFWADVATELFENAMGIAPSGNAPGPVQLNMGFDEFLVPDGDESIFVEKLLSEYAKEKQDTKIFGFTDQQKSKNEVLSSGVMSLLSESKKLIVSVGRISANIDFIPDNFVSALDFPVLADVTSGLRHLDDVIVNYDAIVRMEDVEDLKPDLVIQIGEPLTSKKFNEWIRDSKILSIKPFKDERDPFGNISETIVTSDLTETFGQLGEQIQASDPTYNNKWKTLQDHARNILDSVLEENRNSEPSAFISIGKSLSENESSMNIMIGSSMPIRFAEWFWGKTGENSNIYSHRGTNGIDGILSSTLGIAYGTKLNTVAICGDVTFAHDIGFLPHCVSIAQMHELSIYFVVIENGGGAIFKHLDQGQSQVLAESYEKLVSTPTTLDFEALSLASKASYRRIDSEDFKEIESSIFDGENPGVHILHFQVPYESGYEFMQKLNATLQEAELKI